MVPKIIAKGKSFKGAALYLLHDKGRAFSSNRVSWVETRNLATDDAHLGWKIMAATALDQERLKQAAGVKATGRRSDKSVLHLSLSWHPDEKGNLTSEEMRRAAIGALKAIGADDRQAIFIAHNDEAHPHLHVLCNRVSPEDGRMLPSSKDHLKLSKWAERYEKERGKVYCDERVLNNQARTRGEYTRGPRPLDRRSLQEIRSATLIANDNHTLIEQQRSQQKELNRALVDEGRELHSAHGDQWRALKDSLQAQKAEANLAAKKARASTLDRIRGNYRPQWKALNQKQLDERRIFEGREHALSGRLQNILSSIGFSVTKDENPQIATLFKVIGSKGAREAALMRKHRTETRLLEVQQKNDERSEIKKTDRALAETHQLIRTAYLHQRDTLVAAQSTERAKLRQKWRNRHVSRRREWHDLEEKLRLKSKARDDFHDAASPEARKKAKKDQIKAKLRAARERKDRER